MEVQAAITRMHDFYAYQILLSSQRGQEFQDVTQHDPTAVVVGTDTWKYSCLHNSMCEAPLSTSKWCE